MMAEERIITTLYVRPSRVDEVIGVALSLGSKLVYVEEVVGTESADCSTTSAPYDRISIETSKRSYRETLELMLEAARSGRDGDGKALVMVSCPVEG